MTNIRPLGSLIIIKELEVEDRKTASGLVLSANVLQNELKRGSVVAVGPGDNDNSGKHCHRFFCQRRVYGLYQESPKDF